jgi:uncharacterized protein YecT (DUF1311 family)
MTSTASSRRRDAARTGLVAVLGVSALVLALIAFADEQEQPGRPTAVAAGPRGNAFGAGDSLDAWLSRVPSDTGLAAFDAETARRNDAARCDTLVAPQAALTRCWRETHERRRAELTVALSAAMRVAEVRGLSGALRSSHRAWEAFSEQTCELRRAVWTTGSMAPMAEFRCRAESEVAYIGELATLVGDLTD